MKNIFILLLATFTTFTAHAQRFDPLKNTTTVVIPLAPGGPTDSAGRIFADYLVKQGFPAIAQNKAGAGGTIGAAYVASQTHNPYIVMVGTKSLMVYMPITESLSYNENTFQPVGMIGTLDLAVVTSPTQIRSINSKDFFAEYQANHTKISFGTFAGMFESYVNQLFGTKGVNPNIVLYKSSAQLLSDILSGSVQVGLLDLNSARPLADSGKLNIVKDFELPGNIQSWWAIYAPPGVAKEAVEFYSGMVMAMHRDNQFQERLKRAFNNPRLMTHQEFEQFHKTEVESTRRYLKR